VGSGYSGLESILQLRPEYIKVANSIVHNLHQDGIKA
jgi:EAL domain-containing protein (putative c-di-GMP-specific phosphodiesterase class I)